MIWCCDKIYVVAMCRGRLMRRVGAKLAMGMEPSLDALMPKVSSGEPLCRALP